MGITITLFGVSNAHADLSFPNFPNTTGLTVVGNASVTSNVLRVTPASSAQEGAAWATTQQNVGAGFTTTFTFRITNQAGGGADGMAFVIQNTAVNWLGTDGCRIGYHGLANSVAVEIDTWTSGTCDAGSVNDPNDNHVSVHTRGQLANSAEESASIGISSALPNLSDGALHTIRIDYAPGTLDVFVDDMTQPKISAPLTLATTLALNGQNAWVGFTAATGGSYERHEVTSWTFTQGAPVGSGRPRTPIITEPNIDGAVRNPQDVHMECNPFFSSAGFNHLCSDWEIWTVTPSEMIWKTSCIMGVERLHTHMGDGVFMGSHAGRTDLIPLTNYILKCRHRDDSGLAATEWSLFGQRSFQTGSLATNLPLLVEDVVGPAHWEDSAGLPIVLPAPGALAAAKVSVGAADGRVLVQWSASNSGTNDVSNPATLSEHVQVRVAFDGGGTGLSVPASSFEITNEHCEQRQFFLPAVTLAPGAQAYFWISTAGSSYTAMATDEHASLTALARGTETPFIPAREGYVVEKFASGFQLPVNIAFVPNPGPNPSDVYFYVSELYGIIKMVTRDGTVSDYATGLLDFNPTGAFPGSGEQGLAGLVVDPANGDLYATVLRASGGANHYPRVIRLRSNDGGRTAFAEDLILNMPNDPQGQSHQISNISFGPDDQLYVHVGDGFVASTAQDLTRFRGKILRMTRNGAPLSDNPFYVDSSTTNPRNFIWEYGVRNPFGGGWRLSDASHYIVENGPSVDRFSKLVRGRNMLWDGSDASMMNFAMYVWNPAHAPVNIAFIQQSVFNASGFPPETYDHAFITESGPTYGDGPQPLGKRIVECVIDGSGNLVSGPTTLVEYAGSGRATCVGLAAGPDGLYFSDLYKDLNAATPIDRGANIWRIRYIGHSHCCEGDFNHSGTVTVQDIFDFLAAYFGNNLEADVNHSGTISVQDIFDFLAAYFTPCD